MSAFNRTFTANYVERTPVWHHMAVTWTQENDGLTKIYKDGLLMAEVCSLCSGLSLNGLLTDRGAEMRGDENTWIVCHLM